MQKLNQMLNLQKGGTLKCIIKMYPPFFLSAEGPSGI